MGKNQKASFYFNSVEQNNLLPPESRAIAFEKFDSCLFCLPIFLADRMPDILCFRVTIQRVDCMQRENGAKDKAFQETERSVYEGYETIGSQK